MIADDDTTFVVEEKNEPCLPINSPMPLNFGSGIVIAVDSPYYERYYEKFMQLCLFVTRLQGLILPIAVNSSLQQHDEQVEDVEEENEEGEEDGDMSVQEPEDSDVSSYSDHGEAMDDDDSLSGVFPSKSGKTQPMKITTSSMPPGPAMTAYKTTTPTMIPIIKSSAAVVMNPGITSLSAETVEVIPSDPSPIAVVTPAEVPNTTHDSRSLLHVCILSNFNHMQICRQLIESGWLVDDSPPSAEATGLASGDIGLNIEVFDGKRILRVKLNRFILSSEDGFHFVLQSSNGDVLSALSNLQMAYRELLATQWFVFSHCF